MSEAEWIFIQFESFGQKRLLSRMHAHRTLGQKDRIVGAWWRLDALDRITGLEVVYDPRTEEEAAEGRPTTEGAA